MAVDATSGAPVVLVGFADAFACIEAVWSLQRLGMRPVALVRAGTRPASTRIPGLRTVAVCPPELDTTRCAEDVVRAAVDMRADVVLPLDDAALWMVDRARDHLPPVAGPPPPATRWALDKAAQLHSAKEAGLEVPQTTLVRLPTELHRPAPTPAVAKPRHAVAEVGGRLVRPRGRTVDSASAWPSLAPLLPAFPLLVQPLIQGVGEGVFGLRGPDGTVHAWSAHRRLRMANPAGSASSACESVEVDPALREAVGRMLSDVGWEGLFMAEFLRDAQGTPWFMEVNGRTWGSLALGRCRGQEYAAWAVQLALGQRLDPRVPAAPPARRARHVGRELVHLAHVFKGAPAAHRDGWPSRRSTLAQMARWERSDHLYNWRSGQTRVLVADTWDTLHPHVPRLGTRR